MPEKRLIAAVLLLAIRDLRTPKYRCQVLEFIHSERFRAFTAALDLNPDDIRAKICAGDYMPILIKAFYR